MLMQGDDMLLAFEVWPSPIFKGPCMQLKAGSCLRPFTPCRKNTCYLVFMPEALMSFVVVLMLQTEALKEVANVLLKRG